MMYTYGARALLVDSLLKMKNWLLNERRGVPSCGCAVVFFNVKYS